MSKFNVFASFAAALAMTASVANADSQQAMENCKVVDKNGAGLIKENRSDCAEKGVQSCQGQNKAGDPNAWIAVPAGMCDQINTQIQSKGFNGKLQGVPEDISDKLDLSSFESNSSDSASAEGGDSAGK